MIILILFVLFYFILFFNMYDINLLLFQKKKFFLSAAADYARHALGYNYENSENVCLLLVSDKLIVHHLNTHG